MDVTKRDGYQIIDEKLNLIYPWYTKPFLDWLETQDLSDKVIVEYGIGYSTVWLANHCKYIYGIEASKEWIDNTQEYLNRLNLDKKVTLIYVPETNLEFILESIKELIDIIIIDGEHNRDECIPRAINNIKNGGLIICDNWMQPTVWVAKEPELLTKYEHKVFKQPEHIDWQTAFFIIKKDT